MADGPDITRLGALVGDPARAAILTALLSGQTLTAGELAGLAGVSAQTASGHLARLQDAGLVRVNRQGRHRYFTLDGPEVAHALEAMAGLAATRPVLTRRPGPNDPALRAARVCYDHLAGARGVQMFDSLARRGDLALSGDGARLTAQGEAAMAGLGIDLAALRRGRRDLCRTCFDWSERRPHLAGALGAALLSGMEAKGWLARVPRARHVTFTARGAAEFDRAFT
jgi:DNA-binding transcriptional ArsR family regulator